MFAQVLPDDFEQAALEYHRGPRAGKTAVVTTKPMETQRDLALAYSPGVALVCEAIVKRPQAAFEYTGRRNLVAVITNGTAVLGLGNIGAAAAKPVMEGKAALFKRLAGIDVFDLEVDESDPGRFVDIVASLEPTFGGINLEDIKAPECFRIEAELRGRMNIPVFHNDQHGTAITTAAAVLNGLQVVGKSLAEIRLVVSGAGAAAIACLNLLLTLGLNRDKVILTDSHGVIYQGREEGMNPWKAEFAVDTGLRSLEQVIDGADVFLGLSVPGVLSPAMVATMAERPLILALANPVPEILPEAAKALRPDAVIATGRSDFPNQVNNMLCFPYLFRGALDVGASTVNEAMQLAAVKAIADLAHAEALDQTLAGAGEGGLRFGPEYFVPHCFDPRLSMKIAPAVARAAMETGVASRPIEDLGAYAEGLAAAVFRTRPVLRPLIDKARRAPKRLVYAEGEDRRVLQAAQQVVDEGLARPVLVGRARLIEQRIGELGLRLTPDRDFTLVDPEDETRSRRYAESYHQRVRRQGVSVQDAAALVRSDATVLAALLLMEGEADALLCGAVGRFNRHLAPIRAIIGCREGVRDLATVTGLILPTGTLFICDTHINNEPEAAEIAEMTLLAAAGVRTFGLTPKVALLSRSNFGTQDSPSARRMSQALELLRQRAPDLEVEGEMQADLALSEDLRRRIFGESPLTGSANLLIMPSADAAHIAYSLLKTLGGGVSVGPILVGAARSAHVVSQSITVRGLVDMSTVAVAEAQLGARRRLAV